MLQISNTVTLGDHEIEWRAVRAGGPGGQHVNTAATAVHLRFDVAASSLPAAYKRAVLARADARISSDGVIVIKAQRFRSREKNRRDALERLRELLRDAVRPQKKRRPTRPSRAAKRKRLDAKQRRARTKSLRGKVRGD